ncbi:MAG: helix-turn-helix domain-containing protein [Lachnospiraceae bacterium]|nr:helix-turn-helix domain-containing protein [Lachnospiraceae bacterium]
MENKIIVEALSKGSAFINRCIVNVATSYHSHNFVEIAYVAEGNGTHNINGNELPIKKGNITLINYDVPHKFVPEGGSLIIYNCIFTPAFFDEMLSGSRNFFDINNHFLLGNFYTSDFTSHINAEAGSSENAHILNIFERMLQEYERKQIGYKEIMRGYLIELLVIIFRLQMQTDENKSHKIMESLDYINAHYTQDIKLEHLASMSSASVTNFCRLFKSLTGTTVTHYIQTLRIEEACRLLSSTDKNVIEIANDVGYSDMKHFYDVFKKITHKLPKEFR